MNPAVWVARHGRLRPDDPALADGERVHATWATFAERTAAAAAGLRDDFGLSPGDRVAIVMRNRPEYLEAMYAIWHAGLVAVPVNARLHRDEIAYILEHSETAVVVTDPEHAEDVGQAAVVAPGERWDRLTASSPAPLADREADDPAWLFYTSGTTGQPKGATLTNRNLLLMTLSYYADIDVLTPQDSILQVAPLSHGAGLYGLPHVAQGAVSVFPQSGDGEEIAALLQHWRGIVVLRRSHDGEAARRRRGAGRRRPVEPEDDHLRRRADVPGGSREGAGALRSPPGPDLRAGRVADDDHGAVEGGPRRPRASPLARPHADRRRRPHRHRGARPRRRRPRAPRRRDRRDRGPRRRGDGRLLEPARRHRRDAAGRLAAHRRRRQLRRRRLPHPARPVQGPDHQRRA